MDSDGSVFPDEVYRLHEDSDRYIQRDDANRDAEPDEEWHNPIELVSPGFKDFFVDNKTSDPPTEKT